jgi:hypothetical protein
MMKEGDIRMSLKIPRASDAGHKSGGALKDNTVSYNITTMSANAPAQYNL